MEFPSVTSTVLCSACGKIPGLIRDLIFNPVLRRANPVKAQKSGRTSLLTVSEQSGCISGYFGKQKCPNPYRFRHFLMVEHRGFPARLGQSCRQPGELKSHPPDAFLPCRAVPFKFPLLFTRNTKGQPSAILLLCIGGVAPSKSELNADSISSSEIVCVPC